MSKDNCNSFEEVLYLMRAIEGYNRIVSDCFLNLPDGEELTIPIEAITIDINNRLKRILKAL